MIVTHDVISRDNRTVRVSLRIDTEKLATDLVGKIYWKPGGLAVGKKATLGDGAIDCRVISVSEPPQ